MIEQCYTESSQFKSRDAASHSIYYFAATQILHLGEQTSFLCFSVSFDDPNCQIRE